MVASPPRLADCLNPVLAELQRSRPGTASVFARIVQKNLDDIKYLTEYNDDIFEQIERTRAVALTYARYLQTRDISYAATSPEATAQKKRVADAIAALDKALIAARPSIEAANLGHGW